MREPNPGRRASAFFEQLWQTGDRWELDSSELDRASRGRQIELLADRRYPRALEVGCAAGAFTEMLVGLAERVLAIDIAPSAIERARSRGLDSTRVEFRVANAMELDLRDGRPWDLVVMSETIYYLGWLYPFFDVAWLASEMIGSQVDGGRLLMANTCGRDKDYLLLPPLIDTYRDLFCNVGYELERQETVSGTKQDVVYDVLISLFRKPAASRST